MTTTITRETEKGTYVHTVDVAGIVGALLWTLLLGTLLFSIAYSTVGWQVKSYDHGTLNAGLWQRCLCATIEQDTLPDWYHAVQILSTIGILLMLVATSFTLVYLYLHAFNKNMVLWVVFISAMLAGGVLFSVLVVFGVNTGTDQSVSYVFAVFSTIFCFIGAALTGLQMARSNMLGGH